uniref:Lipase_3 domain-containing protein n=1 Tax=Steinernema glaseri TaxID=37863 RepID=A0A1I8AL92_9BILA
MDCQAVNPCDDLYHHVCDGSEKTKQGISRRHNGLLDALTHTFNGTRAYGFERILNVSLSYLEGRTVDELNDYDTGLVFGQLTAYGRFVPRTGGRTVHVQVYSTDEGLTTKFYVLNGKSDSTGKAVLHHANSTDEIKNDFVRGIFRGFFTEFPKINYGMNPTHESFYYHELEAKNFKDAILAPTSWEKNKLKTLMRIAESMPVRIQKVFTVT